MDIHAYMERRKQIAPGQRFSVQASDQMDAIRFDAQVRAWLEDGGGDGFTAGLPHKESSSGRHLYDQIWLTRE
jgi:hypothetical protein